MLGQEYIDEIIHRALKEDINYIDITTDTLMSKEQRSVAMLIAKEDGVICGLEVFRRTFEILDPRIKVQLSIEDGECVQAGMIIAIIEGNTRAILKAERTALNLLQRLSGIATMTAQMVKAVEGYSVKIVDTRKTTVGLRALEKYAVRCGGGYNHRFNLSDAVLIKDNHIKAVGGISQAIALAKASVPHTMKVEIEVETLEQLQEALDANAEIIMLDNMDLDTMKKAVELTGKRAVLEASGNVRLSTVAQIATTGIDIISCGALTHSVKALDISLKF